MQLAKFLFQNFRKEKRPSLVSISSCHVLF
jgi:hypothetical protein